MTYYESAEGLLITKERALKELRDHGADELSDVLDLYEELGDKEYYDAQDILGFLGY